MGNADKKPNISNHLKRIRIIVIAIAAVAIITAIPVGAWFYYQRQVAALARVDSPISLYINAGHQEDIIYLNMSDIDVWRTEDRYNSSGIQDDHQLYKDFVFCVRGEYLDKFHLQLAYTTNNQFEYELYRAEERPEGSEWQTGDVTFTDTDGTHWQYYIEGGKIPLNKLNEIIVEGKKLGNPEKENSFYRMTYGTYGYSENLLDNTVDKYAVPIYCKTKERETGNGVGTFVNYYILRVIWGPNKQNDRETDIIYIAAGQ